MSQQLTSANKEKLVADLKAIVADADDILRATAGAAGDKVGELRQKIEAKLVDAKERLADAEAVVIGKAKEAATATDDFVHEHPWKAVGVAAAVGLALGVLIGRR